MRNNEEWVNTSIEEGEKGFLDKEVARKIIRVITIIIYLSSVSLAAITLSFYYLFFWNPTVKTEPARLIQPMNSYLKTILLNSTQKETKMRENSVSRGSSNGAVGSEIKLAGNDNKNKMYESKHRRKLVRVLTVIGYLFSVSLAAIMLSLFYMFIYNPGKPAGENERVQRMSNLENLTVKRSFQAPNEEFSSLMNDTYLNLEKEEPRALPLAGSTDYEFPINSDLSAQNISVKQPQPEVSIPSKNVNGTVTGKLLTVLKPYRK